MAEAQNDTLTPKDLAILLRDGHPGVDANISRKSLEKVIEQWEQDSSKANKLAILRESSFDTYALTPTEDYDHEAEEFVLVPSDIPDRVSEFRPDRLTAIAKEFAQEYYDMHCELYQELFEESSLTKKQFIVYLMKQGQTNEQVIAGNLGIEVGTVRSHAARAKKKVEEAQHTARIPDLFTVGDFEAYREEVKEMLEPQSA